MRKAGVLIGILGALCITVAIANLNSLGLWLSKALGDCAVFIKGKSFGLQNTTLFLYGGIIAVVIAIALFVFGKKKFHRH